jgi:hypothetical protein
LPLRRTSACALQAQQIKVQQSKAQQSAAMPRHTNRFIATFLLNIGALGCTRLPALFGIESMGCSKGIADFPNWEAAIFPAF